MGGGSQQHSRTTTAWLPQEVKRRNPQLSSQTFQASERQVALTTFDAAHVGAMHPQYVSHGLLAEPTLLAVGPQVPAQGSLQVAFHIKRRWPDAT